MRRCSRAKYDSPADSKEMDACFLAERDKHTCVGKSCYMTTHLTIITRTESKATPVISSMCVCKQK